MVILFFYKRLKEAGTVSSMAGGSDLGYFSKDRIIVTVQSQRFDVREMAGSQTLGPQFLAASAPVGHFSGAERCVKSLFIHVRPGIRTSSVL